MEYQIITSTDGFIGLKTDWHRIEMTIPEITYFSTYEYCHTWWEVYKHCNEYSLFIVVILNNNVIIGIAPMVLQRKKRFIFNYTSLEFLAIGDYHDFLVDRGAEVNAMNVIKRIFSVIEEKNSLWDEIKLTHINQHSILTQFLLKSGYNKYFLYQLENPYINFRDFESFDNYCKQFLPAKTKQYYNRLYKLTQFSLEVTKENILKKISEIHIAEQEALVRRGKKNRHSFFRNKFRRDFVNLLFTNSEKVLTYTLLDTNNNNKIIGYNTGYLFKETFYSFNTAFDPFYIDYGVGKVLYYSIFHENFRNRQWDVFDTCAGRYQWKFEWTNKFNLLYQFHYEKPENKKLKILCMYRKLKAVLQCY